MKRISGSIYGLLPALFILGAGVGGHSALAKDSPPSASHAASRSFRVAAAGAKASLSANDLAGAGAILAALNPASPLERYTAGSLRMELAVKRGDKSAQRKAISEMLASGAMPAGQEGYLRYLDGYVALQTGALDEGIVQLNRARTLGQTGAQPSLLLIDAYVRRKRVTDAAQMLETLIAQQTATGQAVPVAWYDRGASLAYSQKNWSQLARFYAGHLVTQSTPADWRTATTVYIAGAAPDKEAQLDLIRLQSVTGGLASERDVQGYAALAAAQGYPAEAKAVIESGRREGRLMAADAATTSLLASLSPKAVKNLSEMRKTPAKSPAGPPNPLNTADSLLANAQFAQAVPLYRAGLERGGVDMNRVNTRLGIALARSGDLPGAQAAFARATGAWGDVALYWSVWVAKQQAQLGQ